MVNDNVTKFTSKEDAVDGRKWIVVDGEGQTVGRLASRIATALRGKNLPSYTPQSDDGYFVVVVNAAKVILTGKKWSQKVYYHHSGWPGGLKTKPAKDLFEKRPEEIIRKAVYGMLPKDGALSYQLKRKLKIYAGAEHPHIAQQCAVVEPSRLGLAPVAS